MNKQVAGAKPAEYASELLKLEVPVVLAGDANVMPMELDVYKSERRTNDAFFRIEVREAYRPLVSQRWTDALRASSGRAHLYVLGLFPQCLLKAEVDKHVRGRVYTSDHAPVGIELAHVPVKRRRKR